MVYIYSRYIAAYLPKLNIGSQLHTSLAPAAAAQTSVSPVSLQNAALAFFVISFVNICSKTGVSPISLAGRFP